MKQFAGETPLHVLFLEDDPHDLELVARALADDRLACEFVHARTKEEFEAALAKDRVDVILADFALPGYDGLAALARARSARPEVPFLLVSGTMADERALESLKAGATDYVFKDRLDRLAPAVRRALREAELRHTHEQAEAALRESEERFRQLAESIECVFWMSNADLSRILYISPAYERVWGRTVASLFGDPRSFIEAVHPDDRLRVQANLQQNQLTHPAEFEIEYRIVRPDGAVRWIRDRGFPIRNQRGQLQRMVGIADDITERRQTREALQLSEARFRSIWDRSIDGMRLLDREGRIIAVNEAFCRLVKLPREKLVGQLFSVTYQENRPNDGIEVYRQRFDTETIPARIEARARLWNSEELDLEVSSSFVGMEQGKLVMSIFRDVTERKRAEQRIAAFSNLGQRLSAAGTAREAGEVIVDIADQLVGWDACSFGLYSADQKKLHHVLSMDTVAGRRVPSTPYDDTAPSPLARKAIAEGAQLILKDDPSKMTAGAVPFGNVARPSASILFVPVRDGPKVVGVLSIHSYTPQAYDRHSLDTLQVLADHCGGALNRIRAQEELQAAQGQLRQAQKMEAVGQLAGGVAHDFNNMLAVIRGNAELLLMDASSHSAQTNECLKQITAAADRAANLTRQLLAFSRKQVIQAKPLLLNDVIANLSRMLTRIIGEDIHLECHYAARLPFVQADPGMMEQVLVNLAVNARDAMPHGGQLSITTEKVNFEPATLAANPEARPGEFVCLTVRDTGTGIAPQHLPRIFEPFFTTKEIGKGTGLGLATVYGIIKQHQGWIEVASRLEQGTVLRVFLPAVPAPIAMPSAEKAEPDLPRGTETILLVEDEEAVRSVTRRMLESLGYKICEAASAREALQVWDRSRENVALLLSDLIMPEGVTGPDLAEKLRAQRPTLKLLFMSGYGEKVVGRDTGFFHRTRSHFLQKPCSSRTLAETVRRCLDE